MGRVFVGHDWAEAHHDVFIEDGNGRRLAAARLPEGIEGVRRLHELIAAHAEDPGEVLVATETDRGLFVFAVMAAGYEVIAVNPLSTSRYRERLSTSGAKSDPGDARVLAELARLDGHNHRRIAGDSDLAEAVKVLARAHQTMVWTRTRHTNQIRSTLREFYPAALQAFEDLDASDALAILAIAPTPALGRGLSRSKIAAALRRGGRQRRVEERAAQIQTALRAEHLEAPPVVADAMGASVAALVAVTVELVAQIDRLEQQLADRFEQHPDAKVIRSLPGLGMVLGARALGEFGDDPNASVTPSLARTTRPRHRSPAPRASTASFSPATPATAASPMSATAGRSRLCQPAQAPAPSTTNAEHAATPTTGRCGPSPTGSLASSTAASPTAPSTTKTWPGGTAPRPPLDGFEPWDV